MDTLDGFARAVMTPAQGPSDAGWYFDFANTFLRNHRSFLHCGSTKMIAPEAEVSPSGVIQQAGP